VVLGNFIPIQIKATMTNALAYYYHLTVLFPLLIFELNYELEDLESIRLKQYFVTETNALAY
jgi:hypothetical protein